jgi:hypothetical protein
MQPLTKTPTKVETVGELRALLYGHPDNMPIYFNFDDSLRQVIMELNVVDPKEKFIVIDYGADA